MVFAFRRISPPNPSPERQRFSRRPERGACPVGSELTVESGDWSNPGHPSPAHRAESQNLGAWWGWETERVVGEDVVIRQCEEVVTMPFVPISDHLRIIVAIASERVRMEGSFPPTRRWVGSMGAKGGGEEKEDAHGGGYFLNRRPSAWPADTAIFPPSNG